MTEQAETSAESDYCLLQARIAAIIERHKRESRINPAWIATEAINEIDRLKFDIKSIPHFYKAAHVALTQIARELLGMPNDEAFGEKTPDEILVDGEAQLKDRKRAAGVRNGQIGEKPTLPGLKRNRPFHDKDYAVRHAQGNGHRAATAAQREWPVSNSPDPAQSHWAPGTTMGPD